MNKVYYTPVQYDPGIFGFVKAHRHPSGCAVVMSEIEDEKTGVDFYVVFWVRRLVPNAKPYLPSLHKKRDIHMAESMYSFYMKDPIPPVIPDRQKNKVYDWEDQYIIDPKKQTILEWDKCQEFLSIVWKEVGGKKKCPILTNKRRFKTCISLGGEIHLPDYNPIFRTKPYILHEIAHEITPEFIRHGPPFVKNAIMLYEKFLNINRTYLEETAKKSGVIFGNQIWV